MAPLCLWRWRRPLCAGLLLLSLLLGCLLLLAADVRKQWPAAGSFHPLLWGQLPARAHLGARQGLDFTLLLTEAGPRCARGQVLLILVTSAAGNAEARRAIRRTWAAQEGRPAHPWQAVFLVGQAAEAAVAWAVQREQQEFGDVLVGSYQDTYRNLTLKVMHGLKWACEQCRPRYILKTDDDCFVNTDRLPAFLAELNTVSTGLYVGSLFSREKRRVIREPSSKWYVSRQDYRPDEYPPYASGIGYVLSLDAAEKILEVAQRVRPIPVEDAYVGILAEAAGVRARASARFTKHNVGWRVCNYRYLMVIHQLRPREQEAARRSMLQARGACRHSPELARWK
ncbi:beta-1,3-galactosyltransferase 5-like [Nothoprocta perdicaria]|uniref:beta-1,3-galactosyltransferase 5-like n=1 Tax=Nothoprocta perdicaria TaxID=30464 RepID=UPI000E1C35A9|nr:beta-1,3-galactosyltransferase 5-like [Nothoprocta perdicaria]